ncbi:MAG: alkyl hydroperoxide reductase and/or thiol-specific antioxidant family (AhpC/TSA) protein [Bacteroidota bacterium]|jgi:thioredoxin-related protein|nr:alkyl hydroperoxide reductase and/or thiol-specific antioxidant family (AhpC/TSA) protein [Bacteroidota bacterium]
MQFEFRKLANYNKLKKMKKGFIFFVLMIACGFLLSFINTNTKTELGLNAPIPVADEKMKDVSGKEVSLNSSKTSKGLLVIFSCNTCPYVKLSESRIKSLTDECQKKGIGCIIINSNEAQRADEDSFEAMSRYAKDQSLSCSYVVDANSKVADAFGATRTPQVFLFNSKGLVYKGAIDDNVKDPAMVKTHYLNDAIEAVAKNEIPKLQETKSIGCTIKRQD